MRRLINILQRTFTKEFYRLNALFFLITIGFSFGFMSGVEHRALAEFITSSPVWTLVPTAVWLLYAIKIYSFNNQVCRTKEMGFIHSLSLTPVLTQITCAVSVAFNQFLPAIAYGVFLILTAVKNRLFESALSVALSLVVILSAITALLYQRIGFAHVETRISFLKQWMDKSFEKSFVQFFTEWVVRNQPGMVLITKIFGCLLIFAVSQLYHFDEYDHRLMTMGCLVGLGSSLVIVHQFLLFENHAFSMMRNLPVRLGQRIVYFLSSMFVISLPELIILTRNFPDQLPFYKLGEIVVFSFSIFLLGYRVLLKKGNGFEAFSGSPFISFMILLVLILFSVPLFVLAALAILLSLYGYGRDYYRFEIIEAPEKI